MINPRTFNPRVFLYQIMAIILYIGTHTEILQTVLRLINSRENFSAYGAGSEETAISLANDHRFDLVLLGCGLDEEAETRLTQHFNTSKPSINVVKHYGGGSGLLWSEILLGMEK